MTGIADREARERIAATLPDILIVLKAALMRVERCEIESMEALAEDEGTTVAVEIVCDFTKRENLEMVDAVILPYARELIAAAERLGMTALLQPFRKPHIRSALENGVAVESFDDITRRLGHPQANGPNFNVVSLFPRL